MSCTTRAGSCFLCVKPIVGNLRNVRAFCSEGYEKPDVQKLAKLAQIQVTDKEVEAWTPQLEKVTDFFSQLQSLDLTDVPPTIRVNTGTPNLENLRKDDSIAKQHDDILRSVPDMDDKYLKVPKIQTSN